MVIRLLTPVDAAAYVALRREMLADSPWAFSSSPEDDVGLDPSFIAARLAEPGQAIIGGWDDQDRLVAAAGLMFNRHLKLAHRARIWGVYVSSSSRGRGIGAAILRRALEEARSWPGVTTVGLSASANSLAALALYRGLGFVPWGVEPGCVRLADGTVYDEIHMTISLAEPV
jgi:RimJ/RimL family protein N-acetyltransferase